MTIGYIHSIETAGLVDGPGIRFVVFLQGCNLRCAYCHNPDTWKKGCGQEITSDELLEKVKRYKSYFDTSGGGVTLSGGDPLLQKDFIVDFFKKCKTEGISTVLDTSGYGIGGYDEILKCTDLVLLDIKHIDEEEHKKLTGQWMSGLYEFLSSLEKNKTKIWIRHVVVPGITDGTEHIQKLAEFINKIPNVEKVELLPYHIFGVEKYKKLGIKYRLENVPPLSTEKLSKLYDVLYSRLSINSHISYKHNEKQVRRRA